mmetsp:Transcript_69409/g.96276  ORF Transcript_69409/g.96276 Transcript_69409/m.96276 type:complete len:212 (-) Transcript_69409:437-1072(-)
MPVGDVVLVVRAGIQVALPIVSAGLVKGHAVARALCQLGRVRLRADRLEVLVQVRAHAVVLRGWASHVQTPVQKRPGGIVLHRLKALISPRRLLQTPVRGALTGVDICSAQGHGLAQLESKSIYDILVVADDPLNNRRRDDLDGRIKERTRLLAADKLLRDALRDPVEEAALPGDGCEDDLNGQQREHREHVEHVVHCCARECALQVQTVA